MWLCACLYVSITDLQFNDYCVRYLRIIGCFSNSLCYSSWFDIELGIF